MCCFCRKTEVPASQCWRSHALSKTVKRSAERWHLRSDGSRFRAASVLTPVRDGSGEVTGFAKVIRPIPEPEEPRDQLAAWRIERAALLREVHHRVKNNLQMIVSLISLQTARITDARAAIAFEETQARVRAIAAVHETLYSSADFSAIHVEPYLRALAGELQSTFPQAGNIAVKVEAADLALEIGIAVPLALIVNEILSNSFSHAFPDGRRGELLLKLSYASSLEGPPSNAVIQVSDTGVGFPAGVEFRTHDSLGFDLVRLLAAQLHAEVECDTGAGGTEFRISFPLSVEK